RPPSPPMLTKEASGERLMQANLVLPYAACGSLIVVYAVGRFNTPPSNRSSTRQALYWSSCVGYVLSALTLFAGLSVLLQAGPWRDALLGAADHPSLPASSALRHKKTPRRIRVCTFAGCAMA